MNKPLIAAALVAVLALGAFIRLDSAPAPQAMPVAVVAAPKPATPTPAPATPKPALSPTQKVVDGAASTASKVADAAVNVTATVATGAAQAVKQAVSDAVGAATDSAINTPPPPGSNGAAPTPQAVAAAAKMSWSVATLSLDQIKSRIASADIPETTRQKVMIAFDEAKGDPVKLQSVLDQLKKAMGG
jgi:hypothetical protein